nr:CoA transferase [Streptomyces paludis]
MRVVQLGNFIAAPTAGRLLADFGAEVIKIERPRGGDELRNWRLFEGDTSMLYRTINRNEKSIAPDLRTGEVRAMVLELVSCSDVLIENVGVSIGDSIAGLYAAFGVVMSLLDRTTRKNYGHVPWTPMERHIDVSLHEAVFSMTESLVPDYSAHGVLRERTGGRMQGLAPSNACPCVGGDSVFGRYMEAIGRPGLRDDPSLATNAGRWTRRDELDHAIEAWTSRRTRDEVLAVLEAAGVPAGPIHTAKDIVGDAQFAARGTGLSPRVPEPIRPREPAG